MKIFIEFNKTSLGFLTKTEEGFDFVAFANEIEKLETENSIVFKMFNLNKKGTKSYSHIPSFFRKFLPSKERMDLMKKANIKETDSEFDKLFKLAGLNSMAINFKLRQGE